MTARSRLPVSVVRGALLLDDGVALSRRGCALVVLMAETTLARWFAQGGEPSQDVRDLVVAVAMAAPEATAGLSAIFRHEPELASYCSAQRAELELAGSADRRYKLAVPLGGDRSVMDTREVATLLGITDRGVRQACQRGRVSGAQRSPVTGEWLIPARSAAWWAATGAAGTETRRREVHA